MAASPHPADTLVLNTTVRWDRKLEAGPESVVLSFDRFDTSTYSAEIIADVDNCRLFGG
jgi:hypothetical protein